MRESWMWTIAAVFTGLVGLAFIPGCMQGKWFCFLPLILNTWVSGCIIGGEFIKRLYSVSR
jgi:hypothetical protein